MTVELLKVILGVCLILIGWSVWNMSNMLAGMLAVAGLGIILWEWENANNQL